MVYIDRGSVFLTTFSKPSQCAENIKKNKNDFSIPTYKIQHSYYLLRHRRRNNKKSCSRCD